MLKFAKRIIPFLLSSALVFSLAGCSSTSNAAGGKRIIRIAHAQSQTHPDHLGVLAFEKYVEDNLGDKYDVQIYPNELLGPAVKVIELVQTGAVDFAVASTGNLETFDNVYQIFSMPYLFDSVDAYHKTMENGKLMSSIYKSTSAAGFEAVTWFEAGTRNFYAKTPIRTPEDLQGKKIRVQQSPTNVKMMQAFGAAAAPMSFGEVYTAIQSGVIDGGENNELALTNNKHGEVAKFYSYNQHQMVPDLLIGNLAFLNGLSASDREVFDKAADEANKVERAAWDEQIAQAIEKSKTDMNVEFIKVDVDAFKKKVLPLHEELLSSNAKMKPIYDEIQKVNKQVKEAK